MKACGLFCIFMTELVGSSSQVILSTNVESLKLGNLQLSNEGKSLNDRSQAPPLLNPFLH